MSRTWKEKFIARTKLYMKEHKIFFVPIYIYMKIVVWIYDIVCFFLNNKKRLSCVVTVILFFIVSSSFSFDESDDTESVDSSISDEWIDIQESFEYVPTSLKIEKNEIVDDDDMIAGYNNEELDNQDNIDQFSIDDILQANLETQVYANESNSENLSSDDWKLVLVNKQHPVPKDYTFTLGTITDNMKCDVRIIDELLAMLQAAKKDGVELVICSPYRDYNRQTILFNRKIDYYMNKGYSYIEAYKIASITVTVPGASEHQIGLALDIVSDKYSSLDTGFGKTEAGIWLREHGYEYGFILRYPLGKEYITGIQYEPWHFRYVGKTAATTIMRNGITLEEFLEDLD